jgi:hypothetical protein
MTCWLLLAAALAVHKAPHKGVVDDHALVAYAKKLNVAELDPALNPRRLDEWLEAPAHFDKIEWSKGDCDLKPDSPEPKDGYPLCVRIDLRRGRAWGWVVITVGTVRKGIDGPPRFRYVVATSGALARRGDIRQTRKLSELFSLFHQVEEADKRVVH